MHNAFILQPTYNKKKKWNWSLICFLITWLMLKLSKWTLKLKINIGCKIKVDSKLCRRKNSHCSFIKNSAPIWLWFPSLLFGQYSWKNQTWKSQLLENWCKRLYEHCIKKHFEKNWNLHLIWKLYSIF